MKLALCLTLVALALTACGGGDDDTTVEPGDAADQRQAVNAAMLILDDNPGAGIPIGEPYDCQLGNAAATVPGLCLWNAEEQSPQWLVTFRETWICDHFSRDVAGYPPCSELTGFHEWQYLVTLNGGAIEPIDEIGHFPPDYATQ